MTTTETMELAAELERMTKGTALAIPPGSSGLAGAPRDWGLHVHEQPEWCKALYSVLRSAEMRLQAEATAVERTAERAELHDPLPLYEVADSCGLQWPGFAATSPSGRELFESSPKVETWENIGADARARWEEIAKQRDERIRKDRDLFDAEVMLSDALAGEGPTAS